MGDLGKANETKTSGTMAFMMMQILMSFSFFLIQGSYIKIHDQTNLSRRC